MLIMLVSSIYLSHKPDSGKNSLTSFPDGASNCTSHKSNIKIKTNEANYQMENTVYSIKLVIMLRNNCRFSTKPNASNKTLFTL